MKISVIRAGIQTTIQGGPRTGLRHLGVPASGAADPLSLALANRLVGNALDAAGLEITLTGAAFGFDARGFIAVTGADAGIELNGRPMAPHRTTPVRPEDRLEIGPARAGARSYLAVAGGLAADVVLGSPSTYLPAALGGFAGRALANGDALCSEPYDAPPRVEDTPADFRPPMRSSRALRATAGAEAALLGTADRRALFDTNFRIGNRADRMGLGLDGRTLRTASRGRLASVPVFPGTIQCPEDGHPFLLSVDAQTTGGYPRVAQVARPDRHLIGQLRPGDRLRLLERTPDEATADLLAMVDYWSQWLPDVGSIL